LFRLILIVGGATFLIFGEHVAQ